MATSGTPKPKDIYPRVERMRLPPDIKMEAYSRFNGTRRLEKGFYHGRNLAQASNLSMPKMEQLQGLRNARGQYRCPFCREEEARQYVDSFEDIKFQPSCWYPTVSHLDHHVVAYHMPFIRYYSCMAHDGYVCLTSTQLKEHLREPTREHVELNGYPDPAYELSFKGHVIAFTNKMIVEDDCIVRANPYFRPPHVPLNVQITAPAENSKAVLAIGPWILRKHLFLNRIGVIDAPAWTVIDNLQFTRDMAQNQRSNYEESQKLLVPHGRYSRYSVQFYGNRDTLINRIHHLTATGSDDGLEDSPYPTAQACLRLRVWM